MALPSPPAAPIECPLCARAPPTDGGPEALFAFPCCEQRACAACAAAWVGKTAADDFYRASDSSRRFRRGGACPFCRAPAAPPTVRALQVRRHGAVGCGEGVQRGRRGGKGGGEDARLRHRRSESWPRRGDGVPRPGARCPAKGRSPATRGAKHVYRCCAAEQDGRQRRQRRWQRQRRRGMLPMFFLGGGKLECDGSEQMCQGPGVAALASGKGDDKPVRPICARAINTTALQRVPGPGACQKFTEPVVYSETLGSSHGVVSMPRATQRHG